MKNLNYLNQYRQEYCGIMGNSRNGRFLIPSATGRTMYHVIATDSFGWEHVSISLRPVVNPEESMIERCPHYEEMEAVKRIFFEDEETAMQIYPKEQDYINNHPYVLHLWRRSGQNICMPEQHNPEAETREIQGKTHKYHITIYKDLNWTRAEVKIRTASGIIVDRFPKWNEMCEAKDNIFNKDQATFLFMDNNRIDDFALSWWYAHDEHLQLPNSILVGLKALNLKQH